MTFNRSPRGDGGNRGVGVPMANLQAANVGGGGGGSDSCKNNFFSL